MYLNLLCKLALLVIKYGKNINTSIKFVAWRHSSCKFSPFVCWCENLLYSNRGSSAHNQKYRNKQKWWHLRLLSLCVYDVLVKSFRTLLWNIKWNRPTILSKHKSPYSFIILFLASGCTWWLRQSWQQY